MVQGVVLCWSVGGEMALRTIFPLRINGPHSCPAFQVMFSAPDVFLPTVPEGGGQVQGLGTSVLSRCCRPPCRPPCLWQSHPVASTDRG